MIPANMTQNQSPPMTSRWLNGFTIATLVAAALILAMALTSGALTTGFYWLLALTVAQSLLCWTMGRWFLGQGGNQPQQQARLLAHLRESTAQEERNRLARDLHDTIKQQLFSINVMAATAQSVQAHDPQTAANCLQEVRTLAQAALSEMKALLTQLRPNPLDNIGLLEAIREQLEALHFRAEVATELHCPEGRLLPDNERFPLGAQESLFRAVQESLSNIARHARARTVVVTLAHDDKQLTVTITDDGQGFDPAQVQAGMGLHNIRTRLAELGGDAQIKATPGQGSCVRLALPLFRPRPLVDEAVVNQRYNLAWQMGGAAMLLGAAALYLLFASQPLLITMLVGLLLVSALGIIGWRWRHLKPLLPATYAPWLIWVDVGASGLIGAGLLGLIGILAPSSPLLLAVAASCLAAGSALLLVRTYALRHTVHEWTTSEREEANRRSVLWVLPLFVMMQLLWLFDNGLTPTDADWRLRYLDGNRFAFVWLLAMLLPLIASSLNLHWLRANQAAAGLLPPPAEQAVAPERPVAIQRQQTAAATLTLLFLLLGLPTVGLLTSYARTVVDGWVGLAIVLTLGLLVVKWRVEGWLSQRLAEWTTRPLQQQAHKRYTGLCLYSIVLLLGALAGAGVAIFTPSDSNEAPATLAARLFGGVLAAWIIGLPLYLGMMVQVTQQRVTALTAATHTSERQT